MRRSNIIFAYLFLLHQLGVGAIVDDITAEDGSSQDSVDFLGVDILELSVEDKIVSGRTNSDGGFFAKEDKGEDVTMLRWKVLAMFLCKRLLQSPNVYLFAVLLKELGRIHAVRHGAADEGEPVEDHGRLILVLKQQLLGDIESNRQDQEATNKHDNLAHDALGAKLLDERMARRNLEDAHGVWRGGLY
jgi:hypothetical protein